MRRLTCLTTLCLVFLANVSLAQHWKKIAHFDNYYSPYFVNDSLGFAFYSLASATPIYVTDHDTTLMRTTDGGKSWRVLLQVSVDSILGINKIQFVSPSHGYAIGFGGDGQTTRIGLFETLDSGTHWKRISREYSAFYDLYAVDSTVLCSGTNEVSKPTTGDSSSVLWRTTDHGQTWSHFGYARFVAGNQAGNVINSYGFCSTNNGESWTYRTPSALGWLPAFLPHSSDAVHLDINRGILSRTSDAGLTWTLIFDTIDECYYSNIGADGCAVYVQGGQTLNPDNAIRPDGIIRSTDGGATWKNVGGPTNANSLFGLSVIDHGATVYAMQDSLYWQNHAYVSDGCDLWKTTDGGDGLLSPDDVHTITLGHSLDGVAHADTLFTSLCDSAALQLTFQYVGSCSWGSLQSVSVEGLTTSEYTSRVRAHTSTDAFADSAWIRIHPVTAGARTLRVHAIYMTDARVYEDTSFVVVLNVSHNAGILAVSKSSIDFGAQTMCSALKRADTVHISANGCEAVQVDSIVFRPSDGASTDFGFTSPASFAIGTSDKARAFPITFKPTHPAKESGTIYIYSSNGIDSIKVMGEGVADSRAFIADRDTLRVQMCDSSQGVFRLTNTTCGSLIIDSVTLADGFTLPLASNGKPQLPLALGRDQQEDITIRYEPATGSIIGASSVNVTAHVRYLGKGDTVAFDTVLTLQLIVSRGIPSLALTEQSLDLGDVSTCAADTVSLGILSDGCDTLQITSASLASGTAFTLVREPGSSVPTGSSDSVLISFAPSTTGTVQDTLILTMNAGIRRIPITATGVAGTKTVAQSENEIDFGELGVCQDSSRTVTLTNKGCADVTITDANLTGQGFAYTGSLPITLKPGESTTLTVSTTSDTTGHPTNASGTLTFTTTADNTLAPVTLTRSYEYPARLAIRAVSDASGRAGEEVKFQVLLEGDIPKGMSALYFDLSNDDDLLSFVSSSGVVEQGVTGGTPVSTRTFKLSPVRDTGVIGELTFHTYLAKASTTSLTLSNLHFDYPNLTVPPDCIASVEGSGSDFTYIYECGEGLIQKYMQGESLAIESVAPNPASKTIEVKLRGAERLSMIDVLGREVRDVVPAHEVTVDVSAVSPGTYYLRAVGAGGVRTARVVVKR